MGDVPSADGVRIRYEVVGRGAPALVLVHGWSCDRGYWRHQVEHFAEQRAVVTLDLAGHGESGTGRLAWTMGAFADDVVAVVDALDLREVVLVGHSMGGDVIVEAACRRPHAPLGLVWVDTYRSLADAAHDQPDDDETAAFMAPFTADFASATRAFVRRLFRPDADPDLMEWVAGDMAAAPPAVALDALRHAVTNEAAAVAGLGRAGVPAIAINPEHPRGDVASLARHGIRTMLVPGAGHFVMLEDPAAFNRALSAAMDEFTRTPRGRRSGAPADARRNPPAPPAPPPRSPGPR